MIIGVSMLINNDNNSNIVYQGSLQRGIYSFHSIIKCNNVYRGY